MFSNMEPLENLKRRSVMFWLPPAGRDNGVWADTWVQLATFEPGDATTVLELLAKADVGGYAAARRGRKGAIDGRHDVYVDRMRYHEAQDVVMLFLRGKAPPPGETKAPSTRPPRGGSATVSPKAGRRRAIKNHLGNAIGVMILAGVIALGLAWLYYEGASRFPVAHSHVIESPRQP